MQTGRRRLAAQPRSGGAQRRQLCGYPPCERWLACARAVLLSGCAVLPTHPTATARPCVAFIAVPIMCPSAPFHPFHLPAVLTLFPELHERITEAEVAAAVADAAGRGAASLASSSPAHGSSAATDVAAGRHAGLAAGGALAAGARRQAAEVGNGSTDATGRGQHSQAVDEG